MKINPLFLVDFYKPTHNAQYPKGATKIWSPYTPRSSRMLDIAEKTDNAFGKYNIQAGLQGFIKEYFIEKFNENFFSQPIEKIFAQYIRIFNYSLPGAIEDFSHIKELHELGYLPISVVALPEGTRVPMGVPMFALTNTHPRFAWLVNTLETMVSCSMWHTQMSANVGYYYRQLVNKYWDISVDDDLPRARAIGDFSMRGQESVESAIKSSAAWALSFVNSATVPSILYLEEYYNANIEDEHVIYGAASTEHSVMCTNFAIDGDEKTMVKRLLTEIYPNVGFSMVSDSYDYWNMVNNIIPSLKKEILEHNGYLGIRGDSGDPVEVVTQTVFKFWEIFGGYINKKGFKVLNDKIRVIYGDSITPKRLQDIYEILIKNGFACNNVFLASGSFSMQCNERFEDEKQKLSPFTRDSMGIAIKCTYCEVDGKPIPVFKDPKTDTDNLKKSHKGMIAVLKDTLTNELYYIDELDSESIKKYDDRNLLQEIFCDGKMIKETSLKEIRDLLHDGKF